MSEKIKIENFCGLTLNVELNEINIVIGPQASGKSIIAKLLYFFKNTPKILYEAAEDDLSIKELEKKITGKFLDYFSEETFSKVFSIAYHIDKLKIKISYKNGKISLKLDDYILKKYTELKNQVKLEKKGKDFLDDTPTRNIQFKFVEEICKETNGFGASQIFVPAGRSYYANIHNSIFSFLASNKGIDSFLVEFGDFYQRMKNFIDRDDISENSKRVNKLMEKIICGNYKRKKNVDYLLHDDGRLVNLAYSSSGQQETLPLVISLKAVGVRVSFVSGMATLYIEEPEAHLFPIAQKYIVELMILIKNISKNKISFFITTHSPYVLASINNYIFAGNIENESNKDKIEEIIGKNLTIKKKSVNAFYLKDGKMRNLIGDDGMIQIELLDSVSDTVLDEFTQLNGL